MTNTQSVSRTRIAKGHEKIEKLYRIMVDDYEGKEELYDAIARKAKVHKMTVRRVLKARNLI